MEPDATAATPPARRLRWPDSRRGRFLAVLVAAVLVAGIAFVPLVVGSWSLVVHYACGPGAPIATEERWTPVVLVNSPYGGFGNGTGTYPIPGGTGSENLTVRGGEAAAPFTLETWAIAPSVRVVVPGPGPNAVCTGFWATGTQVGEYLGAVTLQAGATSDLGENTSLSTLDPYGVHHDSVVFDNGYAEADLLVTTCGGGPVVMSARASHLSVDVPFTVDGTSHTASGTLTAAFNWTYSFPGHFGTWSIDDLNVGSHAPGGGWAFSFTPCP